MSIDAVADPPSRLPVVDPGASDIDPLFPPVALTVAVKVADCTLRTRDESAAPPALLSLALPPVPPIAVCVKSSVPLVVPPTAFDMIEAPPSPPAPPPTPPRWMAVTVTFPPPDDKPAACAEAVPPGVGCPSGRTEPGPATASAVEVTSLIPALDANAVDVAVPPFSGLPPPLVARSEAMARLSPLATARDELVAPPLLLASVASGIVAMPYASAR
jgi:hypothetical protein